MEPITIAVTAAMLVGSILQVGQAAGQAIINALEAPLQQKIQNIAKKINSYMATNNVKLNDAIDRLNVRGTIRNITSPIAKDYNISKREMSKDRKLKASLEKRNLQAERDLSTLNSEMIKSTSRQSGGIIGNIRAAIDGNSSFNTVNTIDNIGGKYAKK